MIEIGMTNFGSFASGYIHQMASQDRAIAFARIGGKPAYVKAIGAGLMSGRMVKLTMPGGVSFYHPLGEGKCVYNRVGHAGVITFYDSRLFSFNTDESYIVGKNQALVEDTFCKILQRKPILSSEGWDMLGIIDGLGLVTELETYGEIKCIHVKWDSAKIHEHIGKLVKRKKLRF
jgi:hypothetical protein